MTALWVCWVAYWVGWSATLAILCAYVINRPGMAEFGDWHDFLAIFLWPLYWLLVLAMGAYSQLARWAYRKGYDDMTKALNGDSKEHSND